MLAYAAAERGPLHAGAEGAVPSEQATRAAEAAHTSQAGSVVLPIGLALGVVGGFLAWWPDAHVTR